MKSQDVLVVIGRSHSIIDDLTNQACAQCIIEHVIDQELVNQFQLQLSLKGYNDCKKEYQKNNNLSFLSLVL